MNGQVGRRGFFLDLVKKFLPDAILETGAHRGVTTRFLARQAHARTLACEIDPRFYWEARVRLWGLPLARVYFCDTRCFLENILSWEPRPIRRPIFYLDAHWDREDLPLVEELKIIYRLHRDAILCVDDFRHPTDHGYGFDSYGEEREIGVPLLRNRVPEFPRIFVPRLPSLQETGRKRGCAFLGLGAGLPILEQSPFLVETAPPVNDSRPDHF